MPTLDELANSPPELAIERPEEDWRRIEASIGLENPEPWFRVRLENYVLNNIDSLDSHIPDVRPKDMTKAFKNIQENAELLLNNIAWEQNPEDQSLDAWAQMLAVFDLMLPSERNALIKSLRQLISKAGKRIEAIPPDKGGRLSNTILIGLVYSLAHLYLNTTGNPPIITYNAHRDEPYTGPFFDFVATVISVFSLNLFYSNQGLGGTIKRTLDLWRTEYGIPSGHSNRRPT